jgi:hypothetical protein
VKKSALNLVLLVIGAAALSACGKYHFVKETTTQEMKAKPAVYGEVGGPAKQTKNTYPANPADVQRTGVIKQLLFTPGARKAYNDTAKGLASAE